MRAAAAFLILAVVTGGAQASSFVTPAPMTDALGPSMILLGPPPPAAAAPLDDALLPQLAFPLGSLAAPMLPPGPEDDRLLPALAFALGSLDGRPVEAGPRLAFPLGSLWAGPVIQISPSVIAIGGPAVTGETVAALPPQAKPKGRQVAPTVVRGGDVGGAFPSTASAPVALPAPARSAQTDGGTPPTDAPDRPRTQARGSPPPPPTEEPAPPPAPLPTLPPPGATILRGPE